MRDISKPSHPRSPNIRFCNQREKRLVEVGVALRRKAAPNDIWHLSV